MKKIQYSTHLGIIKTTWNDFAQLEKYWLSFFISGLLYLPHFDTGKETVKEKMCNPCSLLLDCGVRDGQGMGGWVRMHFQERKKLLIQTL